MGLLSSALVFGYGRHYTQADMPVKANCNNLEAAMFDETPDPKKRPL